ncbi:MAG: glycogen phosphorylase [Beggiatoa sp. IS2]|nr:MAG: glycogen phosphorylase [Beggiatoa sp. IS2]
MSDSTKPVATNSATSSLGSTAVAIRQGIENHLNYTVGKDATIATDRDWFNVVAHTLRDRLVERWRKTMSNYYQQDVKRIYYLSLEFLIGRSLKNSMLSMGIYEECLQALAELGLPEQRILELEPDPALGNGGLGRLAACFLDSMATLNLPGYGYGIRYEYGMFYQRLYDGFQVEQPDNWLRYGNPWELCRPEVLYPINFGGHVVEYLDEQGQPRCDWHNTEDVMAMACDIPIPGYNTGTVNNLRLWTAKSSRGFDLQYFNEGNYIKAVEEKDYSENLSRVLYPDDRTLIGRELRFRQEYFFISASIQDIIRRYLNNHNDIRGLPEKVVIQLNDTHPALAIPELMRLLLDRFHLNWTESWEISLKIFSYTNHTLLPEALETWPVHLFERLLPRHLSIIYLINHHFLQEVGQRYPNDIDKLRQMSIISEEGDKYVRMAHLAIIGSHKVNGVAALHTHLMKTKIFSHFDQYFPQRIVNKTNGITPRRWLNEANPALVELINAHIDKHWTTDLRQLKKLAPLADDPAFCAAFRIVKRSNKQRLAAFIDERLGIKINPDSLFDVQIKRMHEYKRQLLNLLHVITLYHEIRTQPTVERVPRTIIFAGKAAPAYFMAKLIIKLINEVAAVINTDLLVGDQLKVVFIPNYDVSTALRIIPAADLSEQISTAGMEASGTGNMKLALNGALTIGTLDGANVEIRDEVGAENIFIFGLTAEKVAELRERGYRPLDYYHANPQLKRVIDMIGSDNFSADAPARFESIVNALTQGGDYFMLLADYADYIACQQRVETLYRDPEEWTRKAILNVANMGRFSSDRTIKEYAEEIWEIEPVHLI